MVHCNLHSSTAQFARQAQGANGSRTVFGYLFDGVSMWFQGKRPKKAHSGNIGKFAELFTKLRPRLAYVRKLFTKNADISGEASEYPPAAC